LRVLIYSHLFPPANGGMQFSNLELAQGLHDAGHRVEVAARWNPGIESLVRSLPFPVRILPGWARIPAYALAPKGRQNWIFWSRYRSILRERLDEFRPDVALISDETSNAFWGSFGLLRSRIPYVSYCSVPSVALPLPGPGRFGLLSRARHAAETAIFDRFRMWMLKSYRGAREVAVVSRSTRERLIGADPGLRGRISVVPRSVAERFFREPVCPEAVLHVRRRWGLPSEGKILLTVTNLLRDKGVDDVLYALSAVPSGDLQKLHYLIAGDGPDLPRLRAIAAERGVSDRVRFLGAFPHDELPVLYDLCDLFLLPSRRGDAESFGRVFAEAAARSRPCVGADAGGMREAISAGETGFLVFPGDRRALTEAIRNLVRNPDLFRKMGRVGRERADVLFTSAAVGLRLAGVLQSAAMGSPCPSRGWGE
jgi:glycosyltransferase involved in cell wall biosynthesis